MKKKGETKNANFIDLDKEEFKKKKGYLKYFFFLSLFILALISIFYYINEDLKLIDKNNIVKNSSEQKVDLILKIDKLVNRIDQNELRIENTADNLNTTQKTIEEVKSKTIDNFDRIRAMVEDDGLKNIPRSENIENNFKEKNIYFIKYVLFRTLINKFLARKNYTIEEDLLISLLKQNKTDSNWGEKFEFLKTKNFKSMDFLLDSINKLIYKHSISQSLQENSNPEQSRSFNNLEDAKTYFLEEIYSLITITKVQDDSLKNISKKVQTNKNNLKLAKEYLLIGNIQKSIEILSSKEDTIDEGIKEWVDSAKLFLSTMDQIEKLEKEIFINE